MCAAVCWCVLLCSAVCGCVCRTRQDLEALRAAQLHGDCFAFVLCGLVRHGAGCAGGVTPATLLTAAHILAPVVFSGGMQEEVTARLTANPGVVPPRRRGGGSETPNKAAGKEAHPLRTCVGTAACRKAVLELVRDTAVKRSDFWPAVGVVDFGCTAHAITGPSLMPLYPVPACVALLTAFAGPPSPPDRHDDLDTYACKREGGLCVTVIVCLAVCLIGNVLVCACECLSTGFSRVMDSNVCVQPCSAAGVTGLIASFTARRLWSLG